MMQDATSLEIGFLVTREVETRGVETRDEVLTKKSCWNWALLSYIAAAILMVTALCILAYVFYFALAGGGSF